MLSRWKAFLAIVFTSIVWGISFISIKVCLDVFPPLSLAFVRFFIATIIIFFIGRLTNTSFKIEKRDIKFFMLAGFLGISGYFYFENNGINLISPSTASIIIGTIPIFMVISESIFFNIKISNIKIIGGIISLLGICIICINTIGLGESSFLGYLFMFGAVICFVAYNISTRSLFDRYSNLNITFYQSLFGTIFLIPSIFIEDISIELINLNIVMNILFLSIVCSAIAYYLYVYALEKLDASICSLYINLGPIITMIFSYFILNEIPKNNQIIGSVFILISVYIVSFEKNILKLLDSKNISNKKIS